jgi:hypothetical protein
MTLMQVHILTVVFLENSNIIFQAFMIWYIYLFKFIAIYILPTLNFLLQLVFVKNITNEHK